jgi:LytS/YehU family sensor histidine kinase
MNTVQALIAKNDTKQARYYLAKFSKLMRKILDNSRHAFISLQEEIEALDSYLNLEKISGDAPFEYEFVIDEMLNPEVYGIPPLILQPFAENSIVHGLKELDRDGKITISFTLFKDYIECKVTDNGRGRALAGEVRHQKSSYHKSTALLLTQERLAMLTTEHNYKSFEVVDLQNPTGTEVIVRIPIIEVY